MLVMKVVRLRESHGLHVRPAAVFARAARRFTSEIKVYSESASANGKSALDLMTLGALPSSRLTIAADGDDAERAVTELAEIIEAARGVGDGRK